MGKIEGIFAETYDRFIKRKSLLPEGLLELVRSLKPDSILEFGCGTGNVAVGLALEGFNITGIDFSSDMLRVAAGKAKEHGASPKFILGDITKVRLNRQFDLIICLGNTLPILTTVRKLESTLLNCRNHLKPAGGVVIFQQLNYDRVLKEKPVTFSIDFDKELVRFKQYHYRKNLIDFVVTIVDGSRIPPRASVSKIALRPWTSRQLKAALKRAGFQDIRFYGNYARGDFSINSKDLIIIAAAGGKK